MVSCFGDDAERTKNLLKLINSAHLSDIGIDYILDLGCEPGAITKKVKEATKAENTFGVDIDGAALKLANGGIITVKTDLNSGKLPFIDNCFDLVMMSEAIEHLYNTDYVLMESFRVLKSSGYLLLTTPNLAWWVNRFTLLLGYQPFFTNVSLKFDVGKLHRPLETGCNGEHIRVFTYRALHQLLLLYGFEIVSVSGATFELLPPIIMRLDKFVTALRPSLGADLIMLAKKTKIEAKSRRETE